MTRILVVDDKQQNRLYLQALLAAHGHDVALAHNGEEALTQARAQPPDLVISDLLMPVMDGYSLLREWKADPALRRIPFIVYTATYTEPEDERLAYSFGADAFILKPTEPDEFMRRVRAVLAGTVANAGPGGADASLQVAYNHMLVRKLEEKTLQLEHTNRTLVQDISQRNNAETMLRLLHSAVLQSGESILIADATPDPPGPTVVFVNPAFTRMSGFEAHEVLGRTLRLPQTPATDPDTLERLRRALRSGEPFEGELSNCRKDGSIYPQEWRVAPIRDAYGAVVHFLAIQRDISERRRSEDALRAAAAEQQHLAEALAVERARLLAAQRVARIGSWETDLDTLRVIWSDESHRIHGTDPATFEPTHQAFLALVHPDDRVAVDAAFQRSIARNESGVIEHRLLLADGTVREVEERWEIQAGPDGRARRAVGTCQDIGERKLAQSQMRESRDRLALATQSAGIGIWDSDLVTGVTVWDATMDALYGTAPGAFDGRYEPWLRSLHPQDRPRIEAEVAQALAGDAGFHTEFRVLWPNGEVRHLEAHADVRRGPDGRPCRIVGVNWDITERKRSELRIRYLSRVYAMLSGVNTLIVRARDRQILYAQACSIAVSAGEFDLAFLSLVHAPGTPAVTVAHAAGPAWAERDDALLASVQAQHAHVIARVLETRAAVVIESGRDDGAGSMEFPPGCASLASLPLVDAADVVGVLTLYSRESEFFHAEEMQLLGELAGDIAFAMDHMRKREQLDYLAYYDELTGLANRTLFIERLGQHLRHADATGGKVALFVFDIERFKNINDSLGRAAGDALLRQIAEWLGRFGEDVSLFARVGPDRFAGVLPVVRPGGDLRRLLDRALSALAAVPFRINNAVLRVAAKAGAGVWPDDGDSADTLFKNAEAALKKAKAGGYRYLFFTPSMNDKVAVRLLLENRLRQALANGEFVLHYQPKIRLGPGAGLAGAEALIRWNDPLSGLVAPGQFIPVLEETGLIHEVGRWAMRQALDDYLRWRNAGLPVQPIAVNVSPLQLRDRGFVAQIEELLGGDRVLAAGLELEITESMLMEDIHHGIASLTAIRDIGVAVAIDDFGTGFSSLSYLARLPLNAIKIDRSFITDMTASPGGLALVSSMISLAHSLDLGVVAEGVETEEQARLLRLLRCNLMQGFLVSPPLPADEFERGFLASPET